MVNLNSKYVKSAGISGVNNASDLPYLNAICKSSANGVRCANCEMQHPKDFGVNYVKICPKTNEDAWWSQVAMQVNLTPINHIGMRRFDLSSIDCEVDLEEYR